MTAALTKKTFREKLLYTRGLLNLPNLLTLFRLALVPLMGVLMEFDAEQLPLDKDWMFRYSPGKVAAMVVALAGVTDLLDGYFARRLKIESLFGKFLDPVVDKVFLLVGLVMLMKFDRVPAWLVIILLSREFLITALRGVAAGENIIIAAGQSGKFKLIFQMVGLGFLMWHGSLFGMSAHQIGMAILYIALVISLYSGYVYLREFFGARAIQKQLEE